MITIPRHILVNTFVYIMGLAFIENIDQNCNPVWFTHPSTQLFPFAKNMDKTSFVIPADPVCSPHLVSGICALRKWVPSLRRVGRLSEQ